MKMTGGRGRGDDPVAGKQAAENVAAAAATEIPAAGMSVVTSDVSNALGEETP